MAKVLSSDILRDRLARQRPLTSIDDSRSVAASSELQFSQADWIASWRDMGHCVQNEDGETQAMRAITSEGQLFWLVYRLGSPRPYHSLAACPLDAMTEAKVARAARHRVKARWAEALDLRRDILSGRERFAVLRKDAIAGGLCPMGVDGFLARIGCAGVLQISARTLCMASFLDEQCLFAVLAAKDRRAGHQSSAAFAFV